MMKVEGYAVVRAVVQIGPDDWEVVPRVLPLNERTTVEEIVVWFKGLGLKPETAAIQLSVHSVEEESC